MQFRIQGKQLQMIRSVYDTAKKRCIQSVIHTVPRYTDKITSDEQIKNLTDNEKEELSAYLTKTADEKLAFERRIKIAGVGVNFKSLTDAILSVKLTEEQSASIWSGLSDVQKALKKSGYQKPKVEKSEKTSASVAPDQAS